MPRAEQIEIAREGAAGEAAGIEHGWPFWTISALFVTAAVLALAAAAVAWRAERRRTAIEQQASRTTLEVTSALGELGRRLGHLAVQAASGRALRWALDNDVDAVTLNDLLATEEWWQPYRDRPSAIARRGRLWASYGVGAEPLLDRTLLEHARGGLAVGWVSAGVPVAAAAVRVGAHPDHLLVLGDPLDGKTLASLAESLDLALLVSDGRTTRLQAGDPARGRWLAGLIDDAAAGTQVSPDGAMIATPITLGHSWSIWGARRAGVGIATPVWLPTTCLLLGVAVLLAAGAVLLGRAVCAPRPSPSWIVAAPAGPWALPTPLAIHPRPDPVPASPPSLDGPWAPTARTGRLGRYTLLEKIGEGGMSEVFTATVTGAEGFQRLFVIKQLRRGLAGSREAIDQFIDEAKLGALLVHSNIVPVLDFGKADGHHYLAQEYIAGRTVAELSRRHRQQIGASLSPSLVCHVAHEVLSALAYAHARADHQGHPLRIVHRDVSWGNVMVTAEGEVKLLDFGIAQADQRLASTEVGHVKGNASFMAPEQARGEPVDGRADLFSLGMVMYLALTGEPFYRALHPAAVFHQAITGPTATQLQRLAALAPPLRDILARALAPDPAGRYPDARSFADAVAPCAVGGKLEAATLMNALFGDELRRETASFRAMLTATVREVPLARGQPG